MRLLKIIREKDIIPQSNFKPKIKYILRKAARAIIFDKNNKIALLFVAKNNYYKLPGGGVKVREDIIEALRREIFEEIGCNIIVTGEVGMTMEYRDKFRQWQKSYCYLAKVAGKKGKPAFTKKELSDGFKLLWVNVDKAMELLRGGNPNNYLGRFIKVRDLEFLKKSKKDKKEQLSRSIPPL